MSYRAHPTHQLVLIKRKTRPEQTILEVKYFIYFFHFYIFEGESVEEIGDETINLQEIIITK